MKKIIPVLTLSFLVALLAGCAENIPFPSGELQGNLTALPADWTELAAAKVIELETKPTEPYSVKLWIVGHQNRLYVHAGANRAQWVENMEADPEVRLLIGEQLFELAAARVTTQAEFDEFANAYEEKYSARPRNENVNEAYLFRLDPRN